MMSGLRATVLMKDGKNLDKEKVTKAIAAKGLKVASYKNTEIETPALAYALKVSSAG